MLFSFETFDSFILLFYFALYGGAKARGRQLILRRCAFIPLSFILLSRVRSAPRGVTGADTRIRQEDLDWIRSRIKEGRGA